MPGLSDGEINIPKMPAATIKVYISAPAYDGMRHPSTTTGKKNIEVENHSCNEG